MATHASATKRAKQAEVKRLRNRARMSTLKTAIRKVTEAVEKKDTAKAQQLLREAQSTIAKTRQKGCIHKNNMARRISQLYLTVNKAMAQG